MTRHRLFLGESEPLFKIGRGLSKTWWRGIKSQDSKSLKQMMKKYHTFIIYLFLVHGFILISQKMKNIFIRCQRKECYWMDQSLVQNVLCAPIFNKFPQNLLETHSVLWIFRKNCGTRTFYTWYFEPKISHFSPKNTETNPKSRKKRTWKGRNTRIWRSTSHLFLFIEYLWYSREKESTHKEWCAEDKEPENWGVKESLHNEEKKK